MLRVMMMINDDDDDDDDDETNTSSGHGQAMACGRFNSNNILMNTQ